MFDLLSRLDAHHSAVLGALPEGLFDLSDIATGRATLAALLGAMPAPDLPPEVAVADHAVPGIDGDPDVTVRTYTPDGLSASEPGVLWIHGGGMVLGEVAMDDFNCAAMALAHGVCVASVDYRLAPEHPYPAPLHDCFAALQWFASGGSGADVDPARIVIGGASAGGGLAAGVALMARDRGGPALAGQLLVYPMIDDTNTTQSSIDITDSRVWNRGANLAGWGAYLSGLDEGAEVPIYAAPSRAADLAGLPPAFINVGVHDMFLDEDIAYARALTADGVDVELRVYPQAFHGSNAMVADSPISMRWAEDQQAAMARLLRPDSA